MPSPSASKPRPSGTVVATGTPATGEVDLAAAGALSGAEVIEALSVSETTGLSSAEVLTRRSRWGPNAVASHKARAWVVLWHQLQSPLLVLLLAASAVSYAVGQRSDAVIIGAIVALSVGLGFGNEYRAEKAAEALHDQLRHESVVLRDGRNVSVDVTELVPGDIVQLRLGDVVPADLRLLTVTGLECDESVLTGESLPVRQGHEPDRRRHGARRADRLRVDGNSRARRQRPRCRRGHRRRAPSSARSRSD